MQRILCPLVGALLILCLGCKSESSPASPPDAALNNPVFPGSGIIETGIPVLNDTVSATPAFTWVQTNCRLVFVGIFADRIIVKDRRILNPNDIIWAWHSGLGTGREGSIYFADGVDVKQGSLQMGVSPTPLQGRRGYIWAVWAWDDDGLKIARSSKEMFFVVQ